MADTPIPFEILTKQMGLAPHLVAAVKQLLRLEEGQAVTQTQVQEAVDAFLSTSIR